MNNLFKPHRLIFEGPEKPSVSEKVNKPSNTPAKVESQSEKNDAEAKLKAKFKETEKKAEESSAKLKGLEELAKIVGDDGVKLYIQAQEKLANIKATLKNFSNEAEEKKKEIDQAANKYIEELLKSPLFINYTKDDPALRDLFNLQPDPQLALRFLVAYQNAMKNDPYRIFAEKDEKQSSKDSGISQKGIKTATLLLQKFNDPMGWTKIIGEAKAAKLNFSTIFEDALNQKPTSLSQMSKNIKIFKDLGLKSDGEYYILSRIEGLDTPETVEWPKNILKLPKVDLLTVGNLLAQYKGQGGKEELTKKLETLLKANFSKDTATEILTGPDCDRVDEVINYITKLREHGFSDNLANLLFKYKVSFEEALKYQPLSTIFWSNEEVKKILEMKDLNIANFCKYIEEGRQLGIYLWDLVDFYSLEKDIKKTAAYIDQFKAFPLKTGPVDAMRMGISIDQLKARLPEVKALMPACEEELALILVLKSRFINVNKEDLDKISKSLPKEIPLSKLIPLLNLMEEPLDEVGAKRALDFYQNHKGKISIIDQKTNFAMDYISNLRKLGLGAENIVAIFESGLTKYEDVKLACEFQKKYNFPIKNEQNFVVPSGQNDLKISSGIAEAAKYCGDDQAKVEILKSVFENTDKISGYNVQQFIADPALSMCEDVFRKMAVPDPEKALMLGRSLYLSGVKKEDFEMLDKNDLEYEYGRLLDLRKKYEELEVYEGREVVVFRHGEKWKPSYENDGVTSIIPKELIGTDRFFNEGSLEELRKSMGQGANQRLEVLGPKNDTPTFEELKALKESMLAAIANKQPPATFIFDAHGSTEGIFSHDGEIVGAKPNVKDNVAFISNEEMAEAIKQRIEKYGAEAVAKDIFASSSCYGHTYYRKVSERLAKAHLRTPVIISASEYGQYGFSSIEKNKGFFVEVMGLGQKGIKLKYVTDHEKDYNHSNPSLYLPDPTTGQSLQVSKNEKNDRDNQLI